MKRQSYLSGPRVLLAAGAGVAAVTFGGVFMSGCGGAGTGCHVVGCFEDAGEDADATTDATPDSSLDASHDGDANDAGDSDDAGDSSTDGPTDAPTDG